MARRVGLVPTGKFTRAGAVGAGRVGGHARLFAMRLKLSIAYDGSAFKGWQSQPFKQTVQDTLEEALHRMTGARVIVHGASRTDTGVHALAQGAHIDLPDRHSATEWQRILNHNLPTAVRIMQCREVPLSFDAQRAAKGKIYRYLIRNEDVISPLEVGRVWLVPGELNLEKLRATAALFEGRHDFGGFAANKKNPGQTVRTLDRIAVAKRGSLVTITFHGPGFLYRMVRMLTGAMVRVARGEMDLNAVRQRLKHPVTPLWRQAAPAGGLYLVKVRY